MSAFKNYPVLQRGDQNEHVVTLKSILRSQGLWDGTSNNVFGPKLHGAVQYFQNTHIGPDGEYLDDDGVVGEDTWWALHHPSGKEQRSNILVPDSTAGFYGNLAKSRKDLIRLLFKEHAAGVREIPDGSNRGDGVDKYIAGIGPAPWCNLLQSWAWKEVTGGWPLGRRQAHVQTFWNLARQAGVAFPKASYSPVPGDFLVWRFADGTGHISCAVATNLEGSKVNTIGGNEGNRVKLGLRVIEQEPRLAGYINLHGDANAPKRWTKTLFSSAKDAPFSSGNTR
jgi:hypothetical protein